MRLGCKEIVSSVGLALVLTACAGYGEEAGDAEPRTALEIVAQPRGEGGPRRVWKLACEPAGGSLPNAERACRRLSRAERPFAPPPANQICTQIYGGPATATVTGTFRGRRVRVEFARTNGCEISRWDRLKFLFPVKI